MVTSVVVTPAGHLTDDELLARLEKTRSSERDATIEILQFLNEVERRKLHSQLGYSSLFTYCTKHLGYSESAAGRRVQAARCLRNYPRAAEMLQSNEINLMTLNVVASILTRENADDLLNQIRGKNQYQAEVIAATYRPPSRLRERVRPVMVAVPAPRTTPLLPVPGHVGAGDAPAGAAATHAPMDVAGASAAPIDGARADAGGGAPAFLDSPGVAVPMSLLAGAGNAGTAGDAMSVNVSGHSQTGSEKTPNDVRVVRRLQVQFLVDDAFMRTYCRVCALLSNRIGPPSFVKVFGTLLDDYMERHSPESRRDRREKRREAATAADLKRAAAEAGALLEEIAAQETSMDPERAAALGMSMDPERVAARGKSMDPAKSAGPGTVADKPAPRSRAIPAPTRDEVFVRDEHRCAYVGPEGRCDETHNLHIDHVTPMALGGNHDPKNLRLLCSTHNQLEADRILGKKLMEARRARERDRSPPGR